MSKFVDKLQDISKFSISPIGFRPPTSESKKSTMLLVAGLLGADAEKAKVVAAVHTDAVLILDQGHSPKDIKQMINIFGDIPLGVLIKDKNEENMDELASSGLDFVVFDIKVPTAVLHKEGIGKFLMIEDSLDHDLVRAINSLDIDGVFIDRTEESFVTVEHLLVYQRFIELLEKPIIITLPSLMTSADLGNLWQSGVDGIVSPPVQPTEALAELRKMTAALPRRVKRRRSKSGVILPRYGADTAIEEAEEEEEDI